MIEILIGATLGWLAAELTFWSIMKLGCWLFEEDEPKPEGKLRGITG